MVEGGVGKEGGHMGEGRVGGDIGREEMKSIRHIC